MCNVRNWTLRKQITVLFVVSTIIFLFLLSIVVAVNLFIMHNETRESVRERLEQNTSSNMEFIIQESGSAVTTQITLLSSLNSQINSLLSIAMGGVSNLIDTAVLANPTSPTRTYNDLKSASSSSFSQNSKYNNAQVSFEASVVYYPNPSVLTQTTGMDSFNSFITTSGNLDKYFPSILTNERIKDVLYVNIYYNQNNAEVLRIYPAYPIPSTYQPKNSVWFQATQTFGTASGTAWIKALGPYIDEKGSGNKLLAISLPLVKNNQMIGAICIEFLASTIDKLVNSITFLQTGEALLINNQYNIISAPKSWQLSSSQIYSITSQSVKDLVGNVTSYLGISSNTVTTISSGNVISDATTSGIATVQRVRSATDATVENYYVIKAYFNSTAMTDGNWLYGILLYTQQDDADQVNQDLVSLMNSDLLTIAIITLLAIILTLSIVACVSFRISTKISRPLRKLMEFSDLVNKNAANKTLASKYFQNMDNDESLIGELIKVYKKVIGISAEPIKPRYSKNQISKREEVEYPLNQFHPDFITKTQGESPINWRDLIEQLPNDKSTLEQSPTAKKMN